MRIALCYHAALSIGPKLHGAPVADGPWRRQVGIVSNTSTPSATTNDSSRWHRSGRRRGLRSAARRLERRLLARLPQRARGWVTELARTPLKAASALGRYWRTARGTVGLVRGVVGDELRAARAESSAAEAETMPSTWADRPGARPEQKADERTIRSTAEAQVGGINSEQSRAEYEKGQKPGGTHAESVAADRDGRGAPGQAARGARSYEELAKEDELSTTEEIAIDEEEHRLRHERHHRPGTPEA